MKSSLLIVGTVFALLCSMSIQSKAQEEICACIHKTNGKMRHVSDAGECQNTEVFLCWSTGALPFAGEVCPDGSFVKGFDTDGSILCGSLCDDQDGDNYCGQSWWGILADCDDTNAAIHPGAEEVCDDSEDNNCDGLIDDEETACTVSTKTVFVTSKTYRGDMDLIEGGGVAGADEICRLCAQAAGLKGTYKAWISPRDTQCPDETFTKWKGAYALVDDTIVAYSWDDLTDGALENPILRDENGDTWENSEVWTGTDVGGGFIGGCSRYTKAGSYTSVRGNTSSTDAGWTQLPGVVSCSSENRLYCFEQ